MNIPIPYGRQDISEEDIKAVVEVLKSDFITQGPKILEFEKKFANYVGCDYAVAVSSGTAALHLSALVLNLKPGDKVITSPITFAATANAIRYCGGEVVFVDIDPNTYLLDYEKVEELLKSAPKGTFKGIIPVDFSGHPVNMESFKKLAEVYGLWIIEDSCHAPGGFFLDSDDEMQYCGNAKYADLAIFSFHPVKHIACGEGGMITMNNKEFYERLLQLRSHGITPNMNEFQNPWKLVVGDAEKVENPNQVTYPKWYMEMQELGYNYRITDIQAALGSSQLNRAKSGLKRRREIAKIYYNAFKNKVFLKGQSGLIEGHAYHLFIIEVKDRFGLYNYLRNNGIKVQVHYFPCHLMPYYQGLGWQEGDFPIAEDYYKNCLSLPIFPTLKQEEQLFIIDKILNYYHN